MKINQNEFRRDECNPENTQHQVSAYLMEVKLKRILKEEFTGKTLQERADLCLKWKVVLHQAEYATEEGYLHISRRQLKHLLHLYHTQGIEKMMKSLVKIAKEE